MRTVLACALAFVTLACISQALSAGSGRNYPARHLHHRVAVDTATSQDEGNHARIIDNENEGNRARINDNVVTVLSGNRDGDSLGIVYDLSEVLDDGDNLRVLPVVGKGSAQNVQDILLLRDIDMGITHSNILNHYAKTGELGDVKSHIDYIAKLFNEEMHIVAGADVKSLNDLRGRVVNFGEAGSGTQLTAHLVFAALGIDVKEVNMGLPDAIASIKKGSVAATILVTGKPSSFIAELKPSDGLKFVPIPFSAPLYNDYYPARLDHADYPNLIGEGQHIDTIANCAVLAAFNWPKGSERYERVARFVDAFFDHFDELRKAPRRAKWRDVNFAATLDGWRRFPASQAWIDAAQAREASPQDFNRFLARNGKDLGRQTDAQREALFRAFVEWEAAQGSH